MATTFKVATLVVKTLVKPVANQLKKNAVHEGWFRDSCHWAGQVSNTILTHVQLRSMGHKVKKIKPMPTDDAVKAGADLFAEGMVLSTGMLAIGAEVIRKAKTDAAAAEKKIRDDILLREKKELKIAEKERLLREQLTRLETRMMEVENAKFATLHEKLLHEQQKHLLVTENLLKRIHYLENELKIQTPYPLLPSHRPPSHPSNQVAAAQAAVTAADQQDPGLYQTMREQTNKLFSYSSFFQSDSPSTPLATKPDVTPHDELMLAEEDLVHHLLDTKLPEICTAVLPELCDDQVLGLAHSAADLVVEANILPEEENLDEFKGQSSSDVLVAMDVMVGNVAPPQPAPEPTTPPEPFPVTKPLEHHTHAPRLADLPPLPPVPPSKAHLSVKL